MQETEEIRAQLVQEIERRERQLKELRATLAQLDAAIKAANEAQAAARSIQERTLAALQGSKREREISQPVAKTIEEARALSREHVAAAASADVTPSAGSNEPAPRKPVEEVKEVVPASEVEEASPEPVAVPPPPAYAGGWSTPGKYARIKVWKAVQNLITENRAPMLIEDIVRELQEGGASLGADPLRTVSTAIGYMNDKIFHVSKSGGRTTVSVLRPSS